MSIFSRTEQIGTLGIGFSEVMPNVAYVDISDISGRLQTDMHGVLWGQYFLYVLKTIEQETEVTKFKKELSLWAQKYALVVARGGAGLSDELFEELAYTGYMVAPMTAAVDAEIPVDKLCFAEIHEKKRGSLPFFRKLKLSPPPLTPTFALSSIMSLAKWILEQDAAFGNELPRYVLALLKRLDLGEKFHFITTIRKADKLSAECVHHAFEAADEAFQQMAKDRTA